VTLRAFTDLGTGLVEVNTAHDLTDFGQLKLIYPIGHCLRISSQQLRETIRLTPHVGDA